MALTYGEWRRNFNEYGTHAEYEEYLRNLSETARRVNHRVDYPAERRYTRKELATVLNEAANLVQDVHEAYETSETVAMDDAVNLAVHIALCRLDHPGASLAEVIAASYPDVEMDVLDFTTEELDTCGFSGDTDELALPEKGSPEWNAALVRKVTGWLA